MTLRDLNTDEPPCGPLGEKIERPPHKPPDKPRWTPPQTGRIVTGPDGRLRTNIPENEKAR